MKMNSDPDQGDALLDAILRDEEWETLNADFKTKALGSFRVRHRLRRLKRWAGGVAALALTIAATAYWSGRLVAPLALNPVVRSVPANKPDSPRFLSDRELVAAFPKGSCFIAEVDGKKQLVFLDPEVRRAYVAGSRIPLN